MRFDRNLLQARFVLVNARWLLRQHRDVFAIDQLRGEAGKLDRLRLRIDRDQPHLAHRVAGDVIEIVVALVTDQPVVVGYQRFRRRRDAAAAAGLVHRGQEIQLVGRVGVLPEIQRKLGVALGIGLLVLQILLVALLGAARVVKMPTGPAPEFGERGFQRDRCRYAPVGGGRTEQVHRIDFALQLRGLHPAFGNVRRQPGTHLHAIGHELLHRHRGTADPVDGAAVTGDEEIHRPGTGRGGFRKRVGQLAETGAIHRQRDFLHQIAARIDHVGFQGDARDVAQPAGRAHDHADMESLARAIQAPIGKQVTGKLAGIHGVGCAAHVEARVVELAVAGTDRQERHVVALGDQVHHRALVVIESLEARERHHAILAGRARQQRLAVDRHHRDPGIRDRPAGVDRLHEHVLAAVIRLLHQHAEIGHHDQAAVGGRAVHRTEILTAALAGVQARGADRTCRSGARGSRARRLRQFLPGFVASARRTRSLAPCGCGIVARQVQPEHSALAVREILAEIDSGIFRLGRIIAGYDADFDMALDDLVFAEATLQFGVAEIAVIEADQMLQLVGQHAPDHQLEARQVARHHRDAPAAAHRKQRSRADELQ